MNENRKKQERCNGELTIRCPDSNGKKNAVSCVFLCANFELEHTFSLIIFQFVCKHFYTSNRNTEKVGENNINFPKGKLFVRGDMAVCVCSFYCRISCFQCDDAVRKCNLQISRTEGKNIILTLIPIINFYRTTLKMNVIFERIPNSLISNYISLTCKMAT